MEYKNIRFSPVHQLPKQLQERIRRALVASLAIDYCHHELQELVSDGMASVAVDLEDSVDIEQIVKEFYHDKKNN